MLVWACTSNWWLLHMHDFWVLGIGWNYTNCIVCVMEWHVVWVSIGFGIVWIHGIMLHWFGSCIMTNLFWYLDVCTWFCNMFFLKWHFMLWWWCTKMCRPDASWIGGWTLEQRPSKWPFRLLAIEDTWSIVKMKRNCFEVV